VYGGFGLAMAALSGFAAVEPAAHAGGLLAVRLPLFGTPVAHVSAPPTAPHGGGASPALDPGAGEEEFLYEARTRLVADASEPLSARCLQAALHTRAGGSRLNRIPRPPDPGWVDKTDWDPCRPGRRGPHYRSSVLPLADSQRGEGGYRRNAGSREIARLGRIAAVLIVGIGRG
jgi:hypothetical protein